MCMAQDEYIRINGIVDDSIVDGPGLRYVVFAQGCPHHCPECHNPKTHDFEAGTLKKSADILREFEENPLLYGITFSGGEPFCQAKALARIGAQVHSRGQHVMTYTGYTYEKLREESRTDAGIEKLLEVTDLLVDGPFLTAKKDLTLIFRGSHNQRLIDLKQMRQNDDMDKIIVISEQQLL